MILNAGSRLESHCLSWNRWRGRPNWPHWDDGKSGPFVIHNSELMIYSEISLDIVCMEKVLKGLQSITGNSQSQRNWLLFFFPCTISSSSSTSFCLLLLFLLFLIHLHLLLHTGHFAITFLPKQCSGFTCIDLWEHIDSIREVRSFLAVSWCFLY